ncbi:hypothetical protein EZV62_013597 [Acer yangbiense]|uniref:Uncharacterized protein n=1 Tax=Acer yangbiense TaxID=1000413 RepID=A0A5C7HZW0_9ROSI|nr:hypothetical protein EZV62_013597 [Acer yangbiense]
MLLLHNVTADTCVSMNQYAQHPASHTALDGYNTLCRQCHCLRILDEDQGSLFSAC